MKKAVQTLVALVILSVPLAASAQEPHRAAPPPPPVTRYTFEDHPVPGRDYAPAGELLTVRRQRANGTLIRVREHFVDEMRKSVERL